MKKQILFIQGGGNGGYKADKKLVDSLQKALGNEYIINYPEIQSNDKEPDFGWTKQIGNQISDGENNLILVGHSFGASMILKCLSEEPPQKKLKGIFLIATPFWSGNEDWKQGLKLKENFESKLPDNVKMFFYHCQDDEEIPFSQLYNYQKKINKATFREINNGGHQLNNDLTIVANDIKST
jgi:predicted alpha/beta hydrolase family esterase